MQKRYIDVAKPGTWLTVAEINQKHICVSIVDGNGHSTVALTGPQVLDLIRELHEWYTQDN